MVDASSQSLASVYSHETERDAQLANVLTEDEARRIASNIAKPPRLLGRRKELGLLGTRLVIGIVTKRVILEVPLVCCC